MKIRAGFVSNSSSSSFYVAYKGGKLTDERLAGYLGISSNPNSPTSAFVSVLVKALGEMIRHGDKVDRKFVVEEYGKDYAQYPEVAKLVSIRESGYVVIKVDISSDSENPMSRILYDMEGSIPTIDMPDFKVITQ